MQLVNFRFTVLLFYFRFTVPLNADTFHTQKWFQLVSTAHADRFIILPKKEKKRKTFDARMIGMVSAKA